MTTATKTHLTAAQKIRRALKMTLSVTARQVSVRDTSSSVDTSVTISIKDGSVSLREVREVAERFQVVRVDELVGDILGGGNTFVSVDYTQEALLARGAEHVDAVEAAMAELDGADRGTLAPITGTALSLGRQHHDFEIWGDSMERSIWSGCSAAEIAGQVALVLDRLG